MTSILRSAAGAAVLAVSLGGAHAATVNISGAGFFDTGTPTSAESAPGQTFAFSFITQTPIPGNPDDALTNPMFTLAGATIAPSLTSVTFSDADHGGLFDLTFSDTNVLSFYGATIDVDGQLQSGSYLAAVALNDGVPAGKSNGFVAVSVNVSPVPLPGSAPLLGGALIALGSVGWVAKRRAKARTPA